MSEHDTHLLTGAYALDALDSAEQDTFERHLADCEPCRQEVAELRATAARLGVAAAIPAPRGMRERVLREAATTRQLPPSRVTRLADRRATRPWYQQPASAAAAVLLVVATGLGVFALDQRNQAQEARSFSSRIATVVGDPTHTERTVDVTGGGRATVIAARGVAVFRGSLPTLSAGQTYQLWRLGKGTVASAGLLGRGGQVTGIVPHLAPGDSVGVTVEPAGGSKQPTTTPVALVGLV